MTAPGNGSSSHQRHEDEDREREYLGPHEGGESERESERSRAQQPRPGQEPISGEQAECDEACGQAFGVEVCVGRDQIRRSRGNGRGDDPDPIVEDFAPEQADRDDRDAPDGARHDVRSRQRFVAQPIRHAVHDGHERRVKRSWDDATGADVDERVRETVAACQQQTLESVVRRITQVTGIRTDRAHQGSNH